MNERELAEKMKAVSKAVAENEPSSVIITLLGTLKKDAAPSEDVLRVSPILTTSLPLH